MDTVNILKLWLCANVYGFPLFMCVLLHSVYIYKPLLVRAQPTYVCPYTVLPWVRSGTQPATSAGVLWERCMQEQLKIPDQGDGCLWASCTHQRAHLPPVPHLLDPWINLMSEGLGQDFNKHPTKPSNLMSVQWMILYVQQIDAAWHIHCKMKIAFETIAHAVNWIGFIRGAYNFQR